VKNNRQNTFHQSEKRTKALEEPTSNTTSQILYTIRNRKWKIWYKKDLNPRQAPGYDLITGRILKEMPRKGTVHVTSICNSIIWTGYFAAQWKVT
jgi:hypothetical protein